MITKQDKFLASVSYVIHDYCHIDWDITILYCSVWCYIAVTISYYLLNYTFRVATVDHTFIVAY